MAEDRFPFGGDEQFYSAIGKLTISWAYVEMGLDWLIREIHEPLDGRTHVEPDPPISLQRKLRYLRRAFNRLPPLSSFNARFVTIADEIQLASEERHDLIHGFILAQEGHKAVMARIIPGLPKPKFYPVSTLSILQAAVRADAIQAQVFASEVSAALAAK